MALSRASAPLDLEPALLQSVFLRDRPAEPGIEGRPGILAAVKRREGLSSGAQRAPRIDRPMAKILRRAMQVDSRKRFPDAGQMLAAVRRVRPRAIQYAERKNGSGRRRVRKKKPADWKSMRERAFRRQFGKALGLKVIEEA